MFDPDTRWDAENKSVSESMDYLLIHNWQEYAHTPVREETDPRLEDQVAASELANFPEYYLG